MSSAVTSSPVKKAISFLWETIQLVAIALILTVIIRTCIIEPRLIPTGSMIPTININERVLVDKIYWKFSELHRQDIIVFEPPPQAFAPNTEKYDFIKRVIGLPGDTVEIRRGDGVYVNGKKLNEPYVADVPNYDYGPVKVPPNSLFVLGDNRNMSKDSHEWGFVDMKKVKGRAFLRFWPLNRFGWL